MMGLVNGFSPFGPSGIAACSHRTPDLGGISQAYSARKRALGCYERYQTSTTISFLRDS